VRFETVGSGPDLVLIHGWAMHSGIFAALTTLLTEKFRVHLVDLPGHGYAKDDDGSLDPLICATRIAEKVPRAIWVGWSLGGLISLAAGLGRPEMVCGIVEIASSPRFVSSSDWNDGVDASVFQQFGAGLSADYRGTINGFLALEAHGSDRAQAQLREFKTRVFERGEPSVRALNEGLQVLDRSDFRERLPQLSVPSLWIAGRRDRLISPAAMRWASERCPDGHFLEIQSGHAPFISHPTEVAEAISSFADEIATR
jgi:pimeloyl-[acyl-carrier protein] methyl ester esterase